MDPLSLGALIAFFTVIVLFSGVPVGAGLLIVATGFLFVFDIVAYAIHNRHSKKSLEPMMNKIELSSTGLGLKWNLQTNAPSTKKRFLNISLSHKKGAIS